MEKFLTWISENSAVICGAFFAFMIAFIQKKGAFMEKISGALLCSLFSLLLDLLSASMVWMNAKGLFWIR